MFDEKFGSGSQYFMGEENIFMYDCFRNKLKMYYIPIKIGTLKVINESNWFKGYNEEYFKVKGAVYFRMSRTLYPLLILQFAIRKIKIYNKDIKFTEALKNMIIGAKNYKGSII